MNRNLKWAGAAAGTVAVIVGAGLWIDAGETGRAEILLEDPGVRTSATATPSASAGRSDTCLGRRPAPKDGDSPDDTPLNRTIGRIDRLATGRHAAVYTGLSVDAAHHTAHVWRIPSAAFDTDVCAAAEKGVRLRLHDADTGRADLDALADRISEDMTRWDGTFVLREVAVDERGYVLVGVDDPDKARPVVEKAFGKGHIRVRHVPQAYADAG
ncbi:hypothetical protein ACIO93_30255 [Streptomyces sp. NPDC087903]|uniref:hypothetical protein n=1 Tax=Streptomyces sp. NPDC087903 TaxID=3365819 RepID=UPI0037F8FCF4